MRRVAGGERGISGNGKRGIFDIGLGVGQHTIDRHRARHGKTPLLLRDLADPAAVNELIDPFCLALIVSAPPIELKLEPSIIALVSLPM